MPQVPLIVNGRTYRLGCGEGDEARLKEVAAILAQKVDQLVAEFGQAGEARLLLMAGLLVADELLDTRAALDMTLAEQTEQLRRVADEAAAVAKAPVAPEEAVEPVQAAKSGKRAGRIELPGKAATSG